MKKFFGVFLMVCMLLTSLSVGVSADANEDVGLVNVDEDTDVYTIYNWDGMLIKGNSTWSNAVVGTRYGVSGTNGDSSAQEGYYEGETFTAQSGNYRVRKFWPSNKLADSTFAACFIFYKSAYESKGTIATLEENGNYYYEITYPAFRSSGFTADVASNYADFNLSDDVYSVSFDFRLPAASLTADRNLFYHNVKDTAAGVSLIFTTKYDATTGTLELGANNAFEELWANTVEVDADTWYTVDTRYALVDGLLLAGVFVNDIQVACYKATDSAAFADGGLQLNAAAVGSYSSSTANIQAPVSIAHYDDILFSVLGDKASNAPVTEEPEETEDAAITYDAATKTATLKAGALAEGTTLQVVVAAYNANGKVEKVKVSESYTALTSDITYTIDDETFPTDAAKYKVFVFDSLASAKPLVEALEK